MVVNQQQPTTKQKQQKVYQHNESSNQTHETHTFIHDAVKTKKTKTIIESETNLQLLVVPFIIKQLICVDTWYYTKINMAYDANKPCLTHISGKMAKDK